MLPLASAAINSAQYLLQVFCQTAALHNLLEKNLSDLFGKVNITSVKWETDCISLSET